MAELSPSHAFPFTIKQTRLTALGSGLAGLHLTDTLEGHFSSPSILTQPFDPCSVTSGASCNMATHNPPNRVLFCLAFEFQMALVGL